jgi:hypothetical protein
MEEGQGLFFPFFHFQFLYSFPVGGFSRVKERDLEETDLKSLPLVQFLTNVGWC